MGSIADPQADRDADHTTYRNYAASFSTDHGVSWSDPKPIPGTGCARPRVKLVSAAPAVAAITTALTTTHTH